MTVRPPNPDALVRFLGKTDQHLRRLETDPPLTWKNIRFNFQAGVTTDSGGFAQVYFSSPFDHECFHVSIDSPGSGPWWANLGGFDQAFFWIWMGNFNGTSYVGNATINYIAFGD